MPLESKLVMKAARRTPVDLEALQARIHTLEQRLLKQNDRSGEFASNGDLEALRIRMQRLEQSLRSELWAARQREHTMLELLSKPPLKRVLTERARHLQQTVLPAVLCWLQRVGAAWWQDSQPEWWPRFAAAWKESLERARR